MILAHITLFPNIVPFVIVGQNGLPKLKTKSEKLRIIAFSWS